MSDDLAPGSPLRGRALTRILARYEAHIGAGYPVTLDGVEETLQVARDVDRTNWLTVYGICLEGIAADLGDVPDLIFLQTTANRRYDMTFNEALAIIRDLRAWSLAAWANWNRLKDLVRTATQRWQLDAIDLEEGWP